MIIFLFSTNLIIFIIIIVLLLLLLSFYYSLIIILLFSIVKCFGTLSLAALNRYTANSVIGIASIKKAKKSLSGRK